MIKSPPSVLNRSPYPYQGYALPSELGGLKVRIWWEKDLNLRRPEVDGFTVRSL